VPVPCFLLFLCFKKATQQIFSELDEMKTETPIFPGRRTKTEREPELIRPKHIYFLEHFCCCFSSNLCVLNATNTDKRCFQQNCSGVSFLCRNLTFSKNPGKYCKNPISPEDPWSQKTKWRGAGRPPHPQVVRPRLGHGRVW
jgi:hypothetical protein